MLGFSSLWKDKMSYNKLFRLFISNICWNYFNLRLNHSKFVCLWWTPLGGVDWLLLPLGCFTSWNLDEVYVPLQNCIQMLLDALPSSWSWGVSEKLQKDPEAAPSSYFLVMIYSTLLMAYLFTKCKSFILVSCQVAINCLVPWHFWNILSPK